MQRRWWEFHFSVGESAPLEHSVRIHTAPSSPQYRASAKSDEFFICTASRCSHLRGTRPGDGSVSCSGGGGRLCLCKRTAVSAMMFGTVWFHFCGGRSFVFKSLSTITAINWLPVQTMWCWLFIVIYIPWVHISAIISFYRLLIISVIFCKTVTQNKIKYIFFPVIYENSSKANWIYKKKAIFFCLNDFINSLMMNCFRFGVNEWLLAGLLL